MAERIKPRQPVLRNCPYCQKLYMDSGQGYCAACADKIREMEKKALAFVEEHPNASVPEVVEATSVPEKIIVNMIQRGQFVDVGSALSYPCSMCGRPISAGLYCMACKEEMLEGFRRFKEQREERIKSGRDGIRASRKRLSKEDFGSNRYKSIIDKERRRK